MNPNDKKPNLKKPKQNTANISKKRISFKIILLFGIALYLFIGIFNKTFENVQVAKNGVLTKGVIVDIRRSGGGKGGYDYYYNFNYNGRILSNSTNLIRKQIGDSVDVIFIKDNPTKNKVKETLGSTYGYFLRRNPNLKELSLE